MQAPWIYDKRPGLKFTSSILPPYMHKSPRLEEAVPILYLRGPSAGGLSPALATPLGEGAINGFSPTTVTRLLTVWKDEYKAWRKHSLVGKNYIFL